jgi:hypothetical protein
MKPETLDIYDWTDTELFSSFDIVTKPLRTPPDSYVWLPFASPCGEWHGESGRAVTSADSNIPRAGYNGLPQGWEAYVVGWRAAAEDAAIDLVDARTLAVFLATTSVRLTYNEKTYRTTTLADLTRGLPMGDVAAADAQAAHWRSIVARVLMGDPLPRTMVIPLHILENLSFNVFVTGDPDITAALRAALKPTDRLIVRIYLRCFLKRMVA